MGVTVVGIRRLLCTTSAAVILGIAAPVWAQDDAAPTAADIKAAGESFDLGRRAFRAKDYIEAAEHFETADARAPSAAALELAFRSREKAGHLDRAATLAVLARKRHPDADFVRKLTPAVIKRATEELHEVTARCDAPCELVVETKLVHGRPDTERVIYLAPGQHTLRAGWSGGRTQSQPVEATPAGKSEVSFTAPPEEKPAADTQAPAAAPAVVPDAPPPESPEDRGVVTPEGWSPTVFFVCAGVTGLLGVATIWSGIDTQKNPGPDTVRAACTNKGPGCPEYQDGLAKQRRTNILAGVTAGVGVVTILVGAFATDWSGGKREAASSDTVKRRNVAARGTAQQTERTLVEPWLELADGVTLGGARGRF